MLVKTYAHFVLSITESECVLGPLLLFQYKAMTDNTIYIKVNHEKKISHCNLVRDTLMKPKWPYLLPGYGCVPNV